LFLEREFLDDDRVGHGDFEDSALQSTGKGIRCECFADGLVPGGREIGGGLDAAVAARVDQLGDDILNLFRAAGVVTTLLAFAALSEVGSVVGKIGVNGFVKSGRRCVLCLAWLSISGQRHDYVTVAVVGGADG